MFVYAFEHWRADYRRDADGYGSAEWTARYYEELRESATQEWRPYVYWRRAPYAGEFINVDAEGIRRTWRPESAPGAPRIFVLGGSTVWGTGARDAHTLPSELARALSEAGRPALVTNLGESGHVSGQVVASLLVALRRGEVPDLAVIYGGVEDVFSAHQNNAAGLPQNEVNRRREFNAMQPTGLRKLGALLVAGTSRASAILLQRPQDPATREVSSDIPALARDTVNAFCTNVRAASALGQTFGFAVAAFWQPVIFTKPLLTPYEQGEAARGAAGRELFEASYAIVAGPSPCGAQPLHDVSRIFVDEPNPRFLDAMHLTEIGNREVADAMVPVVLESLTAR